MAILLDYEDSTELCWTISAIKDGTIIAAVCSEDLTKAQTRLDLLLIELGYNVYEESEIEGLVIY
jgi:hypothetical protein